MIGRVNPSINLSKCLCETAKLFRVAFLTANTSEPYVNAGEQLKFDIHWDPPLYKEWMIFMKGKTTRPNSPLHLPILPPFNVDLTSQINSFGLYLHHLASHHYINPFFSTSCQFSPFSKNPTSPSSFSKSRTIYWINLVSCEINTTSLANSKWIW